MTPLGALACSIVLLTLPWLFMPRDDQTEVRGLKAVLWWINRLYCGFWHRVEVETPVTIPDQGGVLLVCNHTCCVDHLLLQASCRRTLGFLIAKEYFDFWLFHPFCVLTGCIPVRRDGNDLAATRAALRAIEEGRVVPIFPEGHILPTSGREIGEGKQGAAFIALRAKAVVIPAYLRGTPPTNQVVASLATPSHVRVSFGPPVVLADLLADPRPDRDKLPELTDRLMGAIRALRDRALANEPVVPAETGPDPTPPGPGSLTNGERAADGPVALPREREAV